MDLNLKNITFIIVTYKSEHIIKACINSLPKECNKIIIENSKNIKFKEDLEKEYDNIEVVLNDNIGMGAANNIGLIKCKTKYAYVINPDVRFKNNSIQKLIEETNSIGDFTIVSPVNEDENNPNYKNYNNKKNDNEKILSVDEIDGFSMLINRDKFKDQIYFDDSFFLYLENTDLCLRVKNKKENMFIIKDSKIEHLGFSSTSISKNKDIEYLRNWHWMWSKFYFNKKHFGFYVAIKKTYLNLFSAIFKFLIFIILFNSFKRKIYLYRILGLWNSMIGKKSWFRIDV
tara:strand:- start:551 stop:1411 length:861 start_codon:yes stop_codon:yes gene_type:complete